MRSAGAKNYKDYSLKIIQALEKVDQSAVDELFNQIDKIIGTNSNVPVDVSR